MAASKRLKQNSTEHQHRWDGRNPWMRHVGLFHPTEEVAKEADRLIGVVYEHLRRALPQDPSEELEHVREALRTLVGRYKAEQRYRQAPSAKQFKDSLIKLQRATKRLHREIGTLNPESKRTLNKRLRHGSSVEVTLRPHPLRGLAAVNAVLEDLVNHCDKLAASVAGTRGKRPNDHLAVAIPIALRIWVILTNEPAPKNAASCDSEFTSKSAHFMHQLLLALDPALRTQFAAIKSALKSMPLEVMNDINGIGVSES
jgi:hypothetical protein